MKLKFKSLVVYVVPFLASFSLDLGFRFSLAEMFMPLLFFVYVRQLIFENIRVKITNLMFLGMVAVGILSVIINGVSLVESLPYFGFLIISWTWFLIFYRSIEDVDSLLKFVFSYLLGILISRMYGSLGADFAKYEDVANYLQPIVIMVSLLLSVKLDHKKGPILIIFTVTIVTLLIVGASRSAIAIYFLAFLTAYYFSRKEGDTRFSRRNSVYLLLVLGGLILLLPYLYFYLAGSGILGIYQQTKLQEHVFGDTYFEKLVSLFVNGRPQVAGLINAYIDAPILGHGPGASKNSLRDYMLAFLASNPGSYSLYDLSLNNEQESIGHSVLFLYAADIGLFSILFFGLYMVALFISLTTRHLINFGASFSLSYLCYSSLWATLFSPPSAYYRVIFPLLLASIVCRKLINHRFRC